MVGTNRQEDVKNSIGDGEAKELICMIHGNELRGQIAGGTGGVGWRGAKEENWDNFNSIINKIQFKNLNKKANDFILRNYL